MTFTRRFGFWKFGGQAGGTIADNGNQFSIRDRDAMDAVLAALESHDHKGGTALQNPSGAPTYTVASTGGNLPAGQNRYYVVSYVDEFGLETAASSEIVVAMPQPVAAPNPPALAAGAAGTLPVGVYYYALSFAQNAGAQETQISQLSVVTLGAGSGSVVLTLPAVPAGCSGINIYRQGPNDSNVYRLVTNVAGGGTYTDDGSTAISATAAPAYNSTNSTSAVTVTVPDAALVGASPSAVKAWRLYAATSSGAYGSTSLVEHVVATTGQTSGPLVTSWTDVGTAPTDGTPQFTSATLTPSVALSSSQNAGINTLYKADDSTASTVLVADPALSTSVGSGGVYEVEATVLVQSVSGAPIQLELGVVTGNQAIVTGSAAVVSGTWAVTNVAGAVASFGSAVTITPANANPVSLRLTGILDASAQGGQLFLAYASPGGGGLTVQRYSFLTVRKL